MAPETRTICRVGAGPVLILGLCWAVLFSSCSGPGAVATGDSRPIDEVALREAGKLHGQAQGLVLQRKYAEAAAILGSILETEPRHGPANRLAGWAFLESGEVDRGLRHVVRAIEIQPDDFESHTRQARSLLVGGRVNSARKHIETALALNNDYQPAWELEVQRLLIEGQRDAAARLASLHGLRLPPPDEETSRN